MGKRNTKHIAVEPRPGGRWAVEKNGATRASSVHDRKQDAIDAATNTAKREKLEVVIKNQKGQIQDRRSHGNDPPSRKG